MSKIIKLLIIFLIISSTTVTLSQEVIANESLLLTEDFENSPTEKYTTYGETVQTSKYSPYQGTYSGRCYTNGGGGIERAYYKYVFQNTKTSIYIKVYFMISEGLPLLNNDDRFNIIGLFNENDHIASFGVRRISGKDVFYQMTNYKTEIASTIIPQENKYYCLEFLWDKNNDQIRTWIDGNLLTSMTYGQSLYVKEVRLGVSFAYRATKPILIRVDNLSIENSAETPQDPDGTGYYSNIPRESSIDADVKLLVNRDNIINTSSTSFGFMLDHYWQKWSQSSTWMDIAENANFKLIRIADFKEGSPHPCVKWYESQKAGIWDWSEVDSLIRKIFDSGATPLITLGHTYKSGYMYPEGMAKNPNTGLPYASSFAAYAAEWVKHFKSVGLPVQYYEIWNEPFTYFGWTPYTTKLGQFVNFWNSVARSMRAQNSNIKVSNDFITNKKVLNYWIKYGDNVDFLDFHKYDAQATSGSGYYSDKEVLERLKERRFEDDYSHYGVNSARKIWRNARGKTLPVICSETNINSAYEYGTDPRIQKPFGAVWTALMLKKSIEYNIQYTTYYCFASSKTLSTRTQTGGYGFGLINSDDNTLWYPYYVHQLLGNNVVVGDRIVKSVSDSDQISCLTWYHLGKLNTLIICEVDYKRSLQIDGMNGNLRAFRIDKNVPYWSPKIQSEIIDSNTIITLDGYTVLLLQEI